MKVQKSEEIQIEDDFVLKGKTAEKMYKKMMHPSKNEKRTQFTQDALKMFPDPTKPTIITVNIKDE